MTDEINSGDSDQFTSTELALPLRAVHYHLAKGFLSCTRGHVCDTNTRVTRLLLDAVQTFHAFARSGHHVSDTNRRSREGLSTSVPFVQQPRRILESISNVHVYAVKLG